jgi:Ca2+-binding RTX toxin-like protein
MGHGLSVDNTKRSPRDEAIKMSRITFSQWTRNLFRRQLSTRKAPKLHRSSTFEQLGERITPAVNAFFFHGQLGIVGDAANNVIAVSRDAAGNILVNGGAVRVQGGTANVANTKSIKIFGLAGDDTLSLDETNGILPQANIFGGAGNDTLTGGAAADFLFGDAGNDQLFGKGGADFMFGGTGNDVMTGGAGNDQVIGESGNDRMIWNPGDATDVNEGGVGNDTVEVNGGNGAENFTINANGTRVRFDRVDPTPFSIDIGGAENLVVNANGGDDKITAGNGLATLIQLTLDGGTGNDTITGGDGNDSLLGGEGNDFIVGGRGADTAMMGAGDDTFVWNPGDGSDRVEGQADHDAMIFNGADVDETVNISANGERVRFTRDIANITMDLNEVERVDFNALAGADKITVNDLSGTDLTELNLNLAATGGSGDNQADTVIINGTNDDDAIAASGSAGQAVVVGLAAQVNITGAVAAADRLVLNGQAGDDDIDASGLDADALLLTVTGGNGDDTLLGGAGADVLAGNDGDDRLLGGPGNDTLDGGSGDNILIQD